MKKNEPCEDCGSFIEELDEIKDKSRPVIFSAHGVPKSVPDSAKIKKIFFLKGHRVHYLTWTMEHILM